MTISRFPHFTWDRLFWIEESESLETSSEVYKMTISRFPHFTWDRLFWIEESESLETSSEIHKNDHFAI